MKFGLDVPVEKRRVRDRGPVTFDLQFPPSTNNLFLNMPGRGRVPSGQYRAWQNAAGWEIVSKRPRRMPGPVKLTLIYEDRQGRRDLDNLIKPVLDLCVKHQVIDGDHRSVVREINASWSLGVSGVRVVIEPAVVVERSRAA